MKNLLFLVHRIPYPPNKGDKIRSFNVLKHLAGKYRVYLGGFVDCEEDWKHTSELESLCAETCWQPIGGFGPRLSAARAALRGRSLSVGYYANDALRRWVADCLDNKDIDVVVAFSSTMAQFLPVEMPGNTVVLADFVDLDSDKWRQYAEESGWPKRWLYAYECGALARWELDVAGRVDAITLVSDAERQLFLDQYDPESANVEVIRNGVDIEYFDPGLSFENPFPQGVPVALFTGAMDYFANVQGVEWFAHSIWPRIRDTVADAQFWIVGSKPAKEVQALGLMDGITVTGFVPDVRPYLRHATVAVAPLMLARGVQNKVLEALAMNLPVVASPPALRGLDGVLPDTVVSAADAADFAEATVTALTASAAGQARDYVRDNYDWERNLSAIGRILEAVPQSSVRSRTHESARR